MALIRPDQLPSGQDFSFDDILIIETNPNNSNRKLEQITIRDFCKTAALFDPEQGNNNFLVGFQSQFEWMFSQLSEMAKPSSGPVVPFNEYKSQNPSLPDVAAVSPTPTPTKSLTPTPSATPNVPPTPTPTPTPSPRPSSFRKILELEGPLSSTSILLPLEFRPQTLGYSNYQIISNPYFNTDLMSDYFFGREPLSFTPSSLGELINKCSINTDSFNRIDLDFFLDNDSGGRLEPLMDAASIQITLEYS